MTQEQKDDGYAMYIALLEAAGYVVLSKKLFDEMEKRLHKLDALESSGVQNWEWYDDAMGDYQE